TDNQTVQGNVLQHRYYSSGNKSALLLANTTKGCYDSLLSSVYVWPAATAPSITGAANAAHGRTERYQVSNPIQGATYKWMVTDAGTFRSNPDSSAVDIQWNSPFPS